MPGRAWVDGALDRLSVLHVAADDDARIQAALRAGGRVSLSSYGTVLVSGSDEYTHNRRVTQTTNGHTFPKR